MLIAALIRCASSHSCWDTGAASHLVSTPAWRSRAPGRSPRRGCCRRRARGPAGTSSSGREGTQLEGLRRQLAHRGRPEKFEKVLLCRRGRALVWLVRTSRGIAPVARLAKKDSLRLRGVAGDLMTLDQWPRAGSCCPRLRACATAGSRRVSTRRTWLTSPRDKFVYSSTECSASSPQGPGPPPVQRRGPARGRAPDGHPTTQTLGWEDPAQRLAKLPT